MLSMKTVHFITAHLKLVIVHAKILKNINYKILSICEAKMYLINN